MRRHDDTIYYLLAAEEAGPGPGPGPSERTGPVHLEGRAFVDDQGAWNPLLTSLFWALAAERADTQRLNENLALFARHGGDAIRLLGMLSWPQHRIDPFSADYWPTVDALFNRLRVAGLRAQVTLFADAQVMMPNAADRRRFVDAWAEWARRPERADQILAWEIVNEGWQNGFEDIQELRDLGRRLADQTPIGVALTSMPQVENNVNWCEAYGGAGVDFVTIHYDRDTSKGMWRPVRQPWGWPIEYDGGCGMPHAASNNEPIGPYSSVASDADPLRLALAYATTFVSGNAAYVYHCGADKNLWDAPAEILTALGHARRLLPAGCANWTRYNANWGGFPWPGIDQAVIAGTLMRGYCTIGGSRVALVLLDQRATITTPARTGYRLTRWDVLTGTPLSVEDVPAGSTWTIPALQPGSLILGDAL